MFAPHDAQEFTLPGNETIKHASAFVGGMGWIEAYLDGVKLGGDAVLEPGWSQWDARILYSSHDVTKVLTASHRAVALGLVLGNGWPGHLGHTPTGKMLLRVTMQSGVVIKHATNARDWAGSAGPITSDDIYNGESYDSRLELPGWSLPGAAASGWDRVEAYADPTLKQSVMSAQLMQPIRAFQLVSARAHWSLGPNRTVLDFGQNLAGWLRLEWDGAGGATCANGTTITLRHAEYVNSTDHMGAGGALEVANLRHAQATDTYVCDGRKGPFAYEPRFTYHGFRFAEVSGVAAVGWTVSARVVHSDVSLTGHTSDTVGSFDVRGGPGAGLVNAIMRACEWTQRDNLHSVPTDCPQRDERQGWMADASVSSEAAMHYYWMPAFYESWLQSMRDVQAVVELEGDCWVASGPHPWGHNCTGTVADTVPHMAGLFGKRPADPSWGVAYLLIYENMLRYYGDRRLATELYPGVAAYVDWQVNVAENSSSGLVDFHYYGDWLQPGRVASSEIISRMSSAFNFLQVAAVGPEPSGLHWSQRACNGAAAP